MCALSACSASCVNEIIRFKVCVYVYDFLLATDNGQTCVLLLLDATAASSVDYELILIESLRIG